MDTGAFGQLEQAVFEKRPVLREIFSLHGKKSAFEYATSYACTEDLPTLALQNECITEISTQARELFGDEVAKSLERQLARHYYVSTTDHAGPISHPFFVHADLLAAAPYAGRENPNHENFIVLASHNVSLGNSSFPRGLQVHTHGGQLSRINLLPARDRSAPVYGLHPYTTADLARGLINHTPEVRSLCEGLYLSPEALAYDTYAKQTGYTNLGLWDSFFAKSDTKLPRLLYLNVEAIVVALLARHHLQDSSTLNRILFDAKVQEAVEREFDGIPGGFSLEERRGTFLFWYVPQGGKHRIALWRKGDTLTSSDGSVSIALTPEAIAQHMKIGELIPSTMLNMLTLSAYYGLKCLGGFSQVNYLTWMTDAYATIFDAAKRADAHTKSLCGDFIVAPLMLPNGTRVAATGLDFALYNDANSWKKFLAASQNLSLRQTFGLMIPELYNILYPEKKITVPSLDELIPLVGAEHILEPSLTVKL